MLVSYCAQSMNANKNIKKAQINYNIINTMAKKRKKSSSKQVKRVDDNDQESSEEEEEAPVPQRLVAFAVFFLIMLVLVTGYFQMHPKDRFPDQWQTTNLDPDAEYTDNLAQPEQEMDFRPDF